MAVVQSELGSRKKKKGKVTGLEMSGDVLEEGDSSFSPLFLWFCSAKQPPIPFFVFAVVNPASFGLAPELE